MNTHLFSAAAFRGVSVAVRDKSITQVITAWFSLRFLYRVYNIDVYLPWKIHRNQTLSVTLKKIEISGKMNTR